MNIKLLSLDIENFQGIQKQTMVLGGCSATLAGKNGVGKTSSYDAFCWLFFDKDSQGRADFKLRPLDKNNQPIKGLTTMVSAELSIDGIAHTFKKVQEENAVKGQIRGFNNLCWIDEVPKKVGEFKAAIAEIITEDNFRMVTNVKYFAEDEKHGGIHWTERRRILMDVAGDIGTPEGFDELLGLLKGREIKDYKKVLADQKKGYEKERDEINPRIDEIRRNLPLKEEDTAAIEQTRSELQEQVTALETARRNIVTSEQERQKKIDHLNTLKAKRIQRESELRSDTGNIKPMLDEKAEIESGVADKKRALTAAQTDLYSAETLRKSKQAAADNCLRIRNEIRAEYDSAKVASDPDTCSLCGQKLPEDKLAEIADKKAAMLKNISERGKAAKSALDKAQGELTAADANIAELKDRVGKAEIELTEVETYAAERLAKIAELIKSVSSVGTKPQDDAAWNSINNEILELEKSIGPAASSQMQEIETQRTKLNNDIAVLDKALANADRAKKDKARIIELEAKEKELAQKIADVEKLLNDIDEYTAAESEMITAAVNNKFKYVKFKLFNQLLNGSIEPCCEVLWNGKPFSALSSGEQIFIGIDIVNTLSAHYDLSVPLFMDHAESLTLPNESKAQTIELYADRNIESLTLTLKEEEHDNAESKSESKSATAAGRRSGKARTKASNTQGSLIG